ncbi:MAG: hypothetical protein A3F83_10000, partial [Candidatus Glassbacteria bacterium RIFCSPLOWO2_12_FULL_58_11]
MRLAVLISLPILVLSAACRPSSAPEPSGPSRPLWSIDQGTLAVEGISVLDELPQTVRTVRSNQTRNGTFLRFLADDLGIGIQRWPEIRISDKERILALHRRKPWWTRSAFVESESVIPAETEALLWRRADGKTGLFLPLFDQGYRFSAQGDSLGGLSLIADNNMSSGADGIILEGAWVGLGDDPYELLDSAFAEVVRHKNTGSLRREKPLPEWLDYLGWCSWYAFFQEVSEDKFLRGVASLKEGGINPGWVLLDDGWQKAAPDRRFLTSFEPDPKKFPHGLSWLVEKVSHEYGVPYFLIWHAFQGYWCGIDTLSPEMQKYPAYRSNGRSNRPIPPRYKEWLTSRFNIVRPEAIESFYFDYHAFLATSGVDGVKVDNQSDLSYNSYDLAPLTELSGTYIRALENSAAHYFGPGNVIDCMSMVQDAIWQFRRSSIMRTSTDFFPDSSISWGPHLVLNAYNSLVWGEAIQADWDMFKSVHPWAAFHAAGRAISGGPVYLSDEPGKHEFALIRKVALPDGRILRPVDCARPTKDILFRDPQTENVLLKLFNRNRAGTYILGAFNCNWLLKPEEEISDSLAAGLIHGLPKAAAYAVLEYGSREPRLLRRAESWRVALAPGGFRLYTVAPLEHGLAPLGAMGLYNGGGIFSSCGLEAEKSYRADLLSGGTIAFYSERKPSKVELIQNGTELQFDYNADTKFLTVEVDGVQ